MRYGICIIVATICLQVASANAATYWVDPQQSYVSIDVPTWEQGGAINLVGADGSESLIGYEWLQTTRNERFAISGSIDVTILGPTTGGLTGAQLDATHLVSAAPPELGFQIPDFVSFDPVSGAFNWDNSCPASSSDFPIWCHVPFPYQRAAGSLTSNVLTVDGALYGLAFAPPFNMFGGLEPPPDPVISLNERPYAYHVYAAVPEPSQTLLIVLGLVGLALRAPVRAQLRVHSKIEVMS